MKVLVIDDQMSIRNCITTFLERRGHTAYEYTRGKGAAEYALKMRPDLVLIDHNLGLNDPKGLEIAGELQREGQPVILMSGDTTMGGYAELAGVRFVEKTDVKQVIDALEAPDGRLRNINVQGSKTGRWNGKEGA